MALDNGQPTGFNPLQCESNEANVQFLSDLIKLLGNKKEYSASEEEAALWKPGLTTVAMHSHRIGQNAGSLFHKRQEMPATGPEQILLKPELIVRGSSCLRC